MNKKLKVITWNPINRPNQRPMQRHVCVYLYICGEMFIARNPNVFLSGQVIPEYRCQFLPLEPTTPARECVTQTTFFNRTFSRLGKVLTSAQRKTSRLGKAITSKMWTKKSERDEHEPNSRPSAGSSSADSAKANGGVTTGDGDGSPVEVRFRVEVGIGIG